MGRRTLRIQVLLPLSVMILVLLAGFLTGAYRIRSNNINMLLNRQHGVTMSSFKTVLDYRAHLMAAAGDALLADPVLAHALIQGNRSVLLAHGRLYQQRLTTHDITHCYFHTVTGKNLLRLHHPGLYGDQITRFTFEQARQSGEPAQGIELGPLGTLTQRLMIPWRHAGKLIGYLELGTDLSHILDHLALMNDIEYLVTLQKSVLNKELIDPEVSAFIATQGWDSLPDKVITATSLESIPPELHTELATNGIKRANPNTFFRVTLFNRQFAYKIFPFRESSGRLVGSFVLLYDITTQNQNFYRFMALSITLSLLAGLGLFLLAWRSLGRSQELIDQSQQQLEDQIQSISEANRLLENEMAVRQQTEADLATLNAELEQRVTERTRHLARAHQEVEQQRSELEQAYSELRSRQAMIMHQDKMASIGVLEAGVAHDINNPIGYVANNLEELQIYLQRLLCYMQSLNEQLERNGDHATLSALQKLRNELGIDDIQEDFDTLIAESQEGISRVSEIVRNLRSFSRVDDMELRKADIHDCIESAIRITNHELRYKAVVRRCYGEVPLINCRPQQLNQVFMNLLINAVHAIEQQGTITISTRVDGNHLCIDISDTGCGIPEELQQRIFDPFFTTKDSSTGTGLGLSIVSEIIALHHGTISVRSCPGEGTTFSVTLPIEETGHHA